MLSNFSEFSQLFEVQSATYLGVAETRGVVSCDIGLIIALQVPPFARRSTLFHLGLYVQFDS